MEKKHLKGKPPLSWTAKDYAALGEEPPICVLLGKTEGEIMEQEDIELWFADQKKVLCVLAEEYPDKFQAQYDEYVLDLEYLVSLGKITKEECKKLKAEENFEL